MTFSEKLITLRAGRGWSQEQLANKIGVTRLAVGRWEKGAGLPDAVSLTNLSKAFDVTPEWLIDETASGRPEPRRARRVKLAWFDYVMFALTVLSAAACLILRELLYGDAFSSFDIWDVYSVLQRIYQAAVLPAMWFSMGWSAAALLSYLGVRSLTLGKFARPAMIVLGAMLPITFAVTVLDVLVLELWYPYHTLWLIGTPSALAPGGLLLGLAVKRKEKTK